MAGSFRFHIVDRVSLTAVNRSQFILRFQVMFPICALGQFVTVLVTTNEQKQGIAIPRTGLVRGANGQDFVFEHVAAERFMRRAVRSNR